VTEPGRDLPEPLLNELLRVADWRFLAPVPERPRLLLPSGGDWRGADLVGEVSDEGPVDLALVDGNGAAGLRRAREALGAGGLVICRQRVPLPGGAALLRRRLRRAGFEGVRVFWPGPVPNRPPQFWLGLDDPAAAAHLIEMRPAQNGPQAAVRLAWSAARRGGALAPLYAVGRLGEAGDRDELAAVLPRDPSWLLLTGGQRSVNKVVGLPFAAGGGEPDAVVKFARVAEADAALEREAAALVAVREQRPDLAGVPRVRALGRRGGRLALVESRIDGRPLIDTLTAETFPHLSREVTGWLLNLAGRPRTQPREEWWPRLVGERIALFERQFGDAIDGAGLAEVRQRLEGLPDLPLLCEHRDCSPWNVVLTPSGPALLDWESADPRGLPLLDLVYFLAHAAFQVDGALIEGSLDSRRAAESYRRLLDPATPKGADFAACLRQHCDPLGLDTQAQAALRLLCWVLHSSSEHRHLEMETAAAPSLSARRGSAFLALIETDLRAG
jgi:hypothetical protein